MGYRTSACFGVLALACALSTPAHSVVDTVVMTHVGGTSSDVTDYVPGSDNTPLPAVLVAGQTLQYRNMNTGLPHDLTSSTCVGETDSYESMKSGGACSEGYHRLFASDIAGFNAQKPVLGTELLAPGEYSFYCTVHGSDVDGVPSPMAGTLLVVGA